MARAQAPHGRARKTRAARTFGILHGNTLLAFT